MKYLILAASALALTACGNAETTAPNTDPSAASESVEGGVEISAIYVQPPFPGRDVAAGFFSLTNNGEEDRLVSVSSSISENVEIHNHIEEDGVMKMRRIDGVDLPSGETVNFRPGSYHIMMFGANIPEGAEEVSVTLNYEKAEPVTMMVPVGEPADEMDDNMDHGSGH